VAFPDPNSNSSLVARLCLLPQKPSFVEKRFPTDLVPVKYDDNHAWNGLKNDCGLSLAELLTLKL